MESICHTVHQPHLEKITEIPVERKDIHRGHLILVNREHHIQLTQQELDLLPVKGIQASEEFKRNMYLERVCLQQLTALLHKCQALDKIAAVSGYRSSTEQRQLYEDSLRENGEVFTSNYVARPNESEHQTGLAVDVGESSDEIDFIRPSFPDRGACKIFKQLAADYGFIQRYKEGKEHITNIANEPWHFRYVGFPHAVIIEQLDLCLEEYICFLKQYRFGQEHLYFKHGSDMIEIYYVPARDSATIIPVTNRKRYNLSGTNEGGFIVTVFHEKGSGHCGIQ
ncbi:D-alanyl-D-alanine carboxypeptidase family protein [Paenibacillus faecalis]|uniref:D-alanyl-D-alanine carboxypeptidase family protein n=1 Tax=Paenibacillus faecalis TaxID=2079532 RepID=UPI000D10083A|nr:D-alanyl-D-alanine carboxypeptidase family protein [Paenibacillus faecalis]